VGGVEVRVEDPEGCPRFLGAVIRGVAIGPSPDWLRRRLEAAGVRSINNVVDATNYVMLELNQPMHAYDVGKVRGAALVARRGRVGETLVTLDGATRTVDPEMVVIADAERAVGIAGVMGGAETEVSDATRDIFLECASFTPSRVRRARRQLGLSSEASYRFERGVDRWGAPDALRRCIEVVLATAGGTLAEAPLDCWPVPSHPPRIFLRLARAAQVLGVELPLHLIEQYLVAIGATVVAKPEDGRLAVDVPGWRPDLVAEIDLIEEIARLHGFDNFPIELRPFRVGNLPDDPAHLAAQRVREGLVAMGLLEASTLPFGPAETGAAVAVLNPLSAEDAYLRQRLLPGLAREAERNWAAKTRDLRLFEIGTAFAAGAPGERPRETLRVAAVLSGARAPEHWAGPPAHDADLWEVKELAARVAALASPTATLHVGAMDFEFRSADGGTVGWAGSMEADAPPWAAPLFGLEVDIDITPRPAPRYRALPTTPAAERAVALLVPQGMQVAEVEAVIRHAGAPLLESVEVQSDYRGADLPAGTRSVAFRLVFRAPDRTLDSADVGQVEGDILSALDRAGVRRRGA
jgi:phenylalanyl-tRNA synthetase beta chain